MRNHLLLGVSVLLLVALMARCKKIETSISALCEKDNHGNRTIKWEIYPEEEDAVVEIFASQNDSVFPTLPIMRVNANKFFAVVENADSLGYDFFKLKVGNSFSNVITNRFYNMNEVLNFRDIGGYETNEGKRVRWGMVFRSGEFSKATDEDLKALDRLNIQSIVDFRSKSSQRLRKDKISTPNRYELYIESHARDSIQEEVKWDRILKGDAVIFTQDLYEEMFLKRDDDLARFFDLLTDQKNYPLVFHCSLGKDQSGIAAYLLLRLLGVSAEVGEDDYMLSNIGIDKMKIISDASSLTESQQEAFTMLTLTDISYLKYGLACVKKEYGSIEDYMADRLGLTKDKIRKIRTILLY